MCLKPTRATLNPEGGRPLMDPEGSLMLPCGKCFECISSRSSEWATRVQHELGDHDQNCFLTLTYDTKSLPSLLSRKRNFKLFINNLRWHSKKKLSYLVSHEFGSNNARIHHHAIIFGHDFSDRTFLKNSPKGFPLYSSRQLSDLWSHGFHSIGEANAQTGYYIASYALKSTSIDVLDPASGEIITLKDCMDSSRRPAIGLNYLKRNHLRLASSGERLPRYYQKKLKEFFPDSFGIYEGIQSQKLVGLNPRTPHQIFAKFIISEQKKSLLSEFRHTSPLTSKDHLYKTLFQNEIISSRD